MNLKLKPRRKKKPSEKKKNKNLTKQIPIKLQIMSYLVCTPYHQCFLANIMTLHLAFSINH